MEKIQKILEQIFIQIAGFFLWLSIIIINKTLKIIYLEKTPLENLRKKGVHFIYVFWHGQSFVPLFYKRNDSIIILTTSARRGQVLNFAVKKLGYRIISLPGFNLSKDNFLSLLKLIDFVKQGHDTGIVLDGPMGPLMEPKPGAFILSSKTKFPVVPVGVGFQKKFEIFWRWDKYKIPLPFSKVVLLVGLPFYCDENISSKSIEEYKNFTKKILFELNNEATELAKKYSYG